MHSISGFIFILQSQRMTITNTPCAVLGRWWWACINCHDLVGKQSACELPQQIPTNANLTMFLFMTAICHFKVYISEKERRQIKLHHYHYVRDLETEYFGLVGEFVGVCGLYSIRISKLHYCWFFLLLVLYITLIHEK